MECGVTGAPEAALRPSGPGCDDDAARDGPYDTGTVAVDFGIFFGLFSDESDETFWPAPDPPTTVYGRAGTVPRAVLLLMSCLVRQGRHLGGTGSRIRRESARKFVVVAVHLA